MRLFRGPPLCVASLGSDRFRIFSAQAKGAFQCHEISPRVRFALEQSGESRRQVRDALGAGEAKDRHELGAGGLGMVLRQVGEGSAGRRAGATRGELAPVDPVPAAHRLDHPGEIQSSKQASLPAQVAMGLIAEALAQTIQESLTAEEPSMPCLGPRGGRRGSQTGRHEATVGCLRIGPSELAGPGRKQRVVGHPVQAIAAAEIAGAARPYPGLRRRGQAGPDGVEMDVAGQDPEIRLVLDQLGPVAALEEVPAMAVATSPPIGVRREEQLHALGEVGARRLEDQVEVIGQEDKGIQRPSRPPNGAFQASHQPPAVGIVLDDVLPAVTPCHDMIDGIGILDPQSSCHHPIESSCRVSFNKKF